MNKKSLLKLLVLFVIIVTVIFGMISLAGGQKRSANVVDLLPQTDLYGTQIEQRDVNYYLIDVWATWCPPCVETVPELQGFYEGNKDKAILVWGLSVDNSSQKVFEFLDRVYTSYPITMMSKELESALPKVRGIPTLFLYNKEGELLWKHVGSITRTNLEAELSRFLSDPRLSEYQ